MSPGVERFLGNGSIVSIGPKLGGNAGRFPAGVEAFVNCFPCQDWSMWPFTHFIIDLDMLTNTVGCEAGKSFQVAFVDRFYSSGKILIIRCCMVKIDELIYFVAFI